MPCAQEGNVLRLVFIDKATLSAAAAAGSDVKSLCMASCAAAWHLALLEHLVVSCMCAREGGGMRKERGREGLQGIVCCASIRNEMDAMN